MKAEEILNTLDNSHDGFYRHFVSLGHGYSYLLDVRINLFRDEKGSWAITIERLGDNPRAGGIVLEIFYYGNCLVNLDHTNNRITNVSYLHPVDSDSYLSSFDEDQFFIPESEHWQVRGKKISVRYSSSDFVGAGVVPQKYNNGKILSEEICRVVVKNNPDIFRATDDELHKSIPRELQKIMVIDEWYHRDFVLQPAPPGMSDDALRHTFEYNQKLTGMGGMTSEQFAASFKQQQSMNDEWNREQWENNRPGAYETFKLIAKVLETGDITHYKPTVSPNTHWSNWPESGGL